MDLRANTAVDVLIGPFVDSSDGNTTEDGLTISQADVKLSKNGQSLAQKNDNTACAFDDDGYYNCELDATDLNTEGVLVLIVHEAGALPVRHSFNVLSEAAWDSMYVAKDDGFMDVNIKTVGRADTQETEANNLESACANYSATRGLTGTALPAAAADAGGGVPISDAGGLDLDTKLANTNEITVARMGALTDWINGGRLDLLLDAIKAKTDNLPASPAAVGSLMGLANDAITAAKYDETTAFPLAKADSGNDEVARTGADSDTLETLSDEIAALVATVGAAGVGLTEAGGDGDHLTEVAVADAGIQASTFAAGAIDAAALNADAVAEIVAAVFAKVCESEGNYTLQQIMSIVLAVCSGVSATAGALIKTPNGNANRVAATINGSNERTAMTLTPSA